VRGARVCSPHDERRGWHADMFAVPTNVSTVLYSSPAAVPPHCWVDVAAGFREQHFAQWRELLT
jgi:hypothetical protein